nr:hypothetical protein [Tanacetum cinerariifolium]
ENIQLLKVEVQARDTALVSLRQKLNQAEQERDDLKIKFDKFQTSSQSLTELLASQKHDKQGLGYSSSKNDSESLSPSCPSDRLQPSGRYNVVPPSITGNFMPPKPNLVIHTAPITVETAHSAFTVKLSSSKPTQDLSHTNRPSAPIIEEWFSDFEDYSKTTAPQIAHSSIQSNKQVTPPRHSVQPVEAPIPAATPKTTTPKTNRSGKRKNRKTCFVCRSVDHLIKDCYFHAKPKPLPTLRNYAHRGHTKQNASFPQKHLQMHMDPAAVFTQSKPVSVTAVRPVSAAVPKIMKSRPKYTHTLATQSKATIRRHKTRSHFSKTSNSSSRVTTAKAQRFTAAKSKQGKWIWKPKCPTLDHDFRTTGLESVEARLVVYKQNESILEENIQLLKVEMQVRDTALVFLRQKLNQAEQERDDLKLKFDKFQTSSQSLTEFLASQKHDKQGNFMPPKPDLVFHTTPIAVETAHSAFTVKLSSSEPTQDLSHTNRPSAPIIEECFSDSEDDSETTAPQIA